MNDKLAYLVVGLALGVFFALGETTNAIGLLWTALVLYGLVAVVLFLYLFYTIVKPERIPEFAAFGYSIEHLAAIFLLGIAVNTTFLRVAHLLFAAEYVANHAEVAFTPGSYLDRLYFVVQATGILGFGEILPRNTAARITTLFQFLLTPTLILSLLTTQLTERNANNLPDPSAEA